MADIKISDMTAATDVVSAVVPIVQGGSNKKADSRLFGVARVQTYRNTHRGSNDNYQD
jgi:hypothetical protein